MDRQTTRNKIPVATEYCQLLTLHMNNVVIQIVSQNRLGKLPQEALQHGRWNVCVAQACEVDSHTYVTWTMLTLGLI